MPPALETHVDRPVVDDQSATIAFLSSPAAHGGAAVERIDTHASIIFMASDRAWKLKRAVRYPYLDFSTAVRRRAMTEAEFALNQPGAPGIYRRVAPVTRDETGRLAINGQGQPVDWLIEMTRFEQAELFDHLATQGALDLSLMPPLATAIANRHESGERRWDRGGHAGLSWVIDGNAAAFRDEPLSAADAALGQRVTEAAREWTERLRGLLDARREAGFVRCCHGDLHLGNIVRFEGAPTLFDAVEFNDAISCVDVLYDLAFVLMDLWRLSLPHHANALLNAYVLDTFDLEGLGALPLFLACRAAVRAKTVATAARLQQDDAHRSALAAESHAYLTLADRLLHPPPPCLVAIGGLSGSGKSALALALAADTGPAPGAIVLRSDAVRKRLAGVAPFTRLGADAYTPAMSARVYDTIALHAHAVLAARHAVIVDATFLGHADRHAIEHIARDAGVPFAGLWLDAPEPARIDRVRCRTLDPSDADSDIARQQTVEAPETMSWHHLDASLPADRVRHDAGRVLDRIRLDGPVAVANGRTR